MIELQTRLRRDGGLLLPKRARHGRRLRHYIVCVPGGGSFAAWSLIGVRRHLIDGNYRI